MRTYYLPTTPEEEAEILRRAAEYGDPRGFGCAQAVSSVLDGIGPFQELGSPRLTPGTLEQALKSIKAPGTFPN